MESLYPLLNEKLYQLNVDWFHRFDKITLEKDRGWFGGLGLFWMHNLDYTRGFLYTQEPYPHTGYYDSNLNRVGTSFGYGYFWTKPFFVEITGTINLLAIAWQTLYNNPNGNIEYFASPGFIIRFRMPEKIVAAPAEPAQPTTQP